MNEAKTFFETVKHKSTRNFSDSEACNTLRLSWSSFRINFKVLNMKSIIVYLGTVLQIKIAIFISLKC